MCIIAFLATFHSIFSLQIDSRYAMDFREEIVHVHLHRQGVTAWHSQAKQVNWWTFEINQKYINTNKFSPNRIFHTNQVFFFAFQPSWYNNNKKLKFSSRQNNS